jgi:tRNA (guanine37-N1)-methyltransferase
MGGDIPTMLILEGLFRFIPGVVGREESVARDSFSGPFVDHPEYTKPVVWQGKEVPEIVRSGNHAQIEIWRKQEAAKKTVLHHFNWLRSADLQEQDMQLAKHYIPSHYTALLHGDMRLKEGRIGTTSVTTIDIHDIARSSTTYGIKNFFIVTPLLDQQNLVNTVLGFWHETTKGVQYNKQRHLALKQVQVKSNLDQVIEKIKEIEGVEPLIIGTSAREADMLVPLITYFDQEKVWAQGRPVLFIFGTGYGISDTILKKCDFMLPPLQGFSDFNHLSVRSAVGIILDKWLGLNRQAV